MLNKQLERHIQVLNNAGKFTRTYTDIPNNHPIVSEYVGEWKQLAEFVGIDWEATGHTISVKKGDKVAIYTPGVVSKDGKLQLCWGNTSVAIADLKCDYDLTVTTRNTVELDIMLGDECYSFPVIITKEVAAKLKSGEMKVGNIRAAVKSGKLEYFLAKGGGFHKLSDLKPGRYNIINVKTDEKFNKMYVALEGQPGWYKANKSLEEQLLYGVATITKDTPAIMVLGESTGNYNGYPVFPVTVILPSDNELPLFDFGDTEIDYNDVPAL